MRTSSTYRNNNTTGRSTNRRFTTTNNTTSYGSTGTGTTGYSPTQFKAYAPTQFKNISRCISQCIGSFRNIQSQFNGAGRVTAFSPNTVNRWVGYVNKGAYVYKFTNQDFCKHFGPRFNTPTTTTNACRFLRNKFGAGIKDVTRGKGGTWLIAANPNVTARPFSTYKW